MSKQTLVDTLNNVTGDIQLGMNVGGIVIPIIIGGVKQIKAWLNEQGNIEFSVAVDTGNQDIAAGLQSFKDSLALVNTELVKDGKDPLPDPTA